MSKTFSQVIADQRRGVLSNVAGDSYAELVKQVKATGRKGSFVLKLDLVPSANTGAITIYDDIKVTPPKPDRAADSMFATEEGIMQRNDPNQPDLPGLRSVEAPTPKVVYVTVDSSTGEVIGTPSTEKPAIAVTQPAINAVAIALQAQQGAPVSLAPSQGKTVDPPAAAA